MSAKRFVEILILSLAFVGVAMAARSPAQIEHDIGNKVICLCGCQTSLNDCPMLHCEVKEQMRALIQADLAKGKTEHAVIQDLVDRYGERVLYAPPPHGFNLAAWILPGLGLIIGLLLAIAIVRRWLRPAPQPAGAATPPDENVRAAVEEEMKKYIS